MFKAYKSLKIHSLADKILNVIKQLNSIPFLFNSNFLNVDERLRKYSLLKKDKKKKVKKYDVLLLSKNM